MDVKYFQQYTCSWFGWYIVYGVQRHFQQYFSYIVVVSFIDGENH
jgi:hypothetical protein